MKKILIIEDDGLIAKIYKTRLSAEGYEVVLAADGEAGLNTARQIRPDLILLDLMIPKMSGVDVLAGIKNNPETKETLVLVYSNLSDEQEIARVKALGATEFLVKAMISAPALVEKIKGYLQ